MAKKSSPALLPGLEAGGVLPAEPHIGVDEVGRGCLAGPVVACALSLPPAFDLPGLDDSKKLTAKKREELALLILKQAEAVGLGLVSPLRIDEINILQATFEAMALALRQHAMGRGQGPPGEYPEPLTLEACRDLDGKAEFAAVDALVLVDGNRLVPEETLARVFGLGEEFFANPRNKGHFRQRSVVGGDGKIPAISAASIVAKTWRDHLMTGLDAEYKGYGLAGHKGYSTKEHLEALKRLGPSPVHRLTFAGVR